MKSLLIRIYNFLRLYYIWQPIKSLKPAYHCAQRLHSRNIGTTLLLLFDIVFCNVRYGASLEDYVAMEFYRKSHRECNRFVTFRRNFVYFFNKLYDPSQIDKFDKKNNFNHVFANHIKHDWLFTGDSTIDMIQRFIESHRIVIVKPNDGCEGIGVYKLDANDKSSCQGLFEDIANGKMFMIEQVIMQHHDMERLNSSSINTLRIETCIDNKGVVHVSNTIVIMGNGDACVNNTHHGGIMCHIDPETGIIDSWAHDPQGNSFFMHPSSKVVLPGYHIPHFQGAVEFAKKLALVEPKCRLIGWDIVVTNNGFDVIEGNVRPGHCTQACDGVGRYHMIKSLI